MSGGIAASNERGKALGVAVMRLPANSAGVI